MRPLNELHILPNANITSTDEEDRVGDLLIDFFI